MKLIVVDSRHNIGSWLIKAFTFSKWNHTAIMFDDGTVFDSTFFSGVRALSYEEFSRIYPRHRQYIVNISVPNEKASRDFAEEQLGKAYDWTAVIGIIFQKRKWNDISDWFCSELSETIISKGGVTYFRIDASSILPRESHSIARGEVINLE